VNQQTTDDLRVLKATCYLTPKQLTANAVKTGDDRSSEYGNEAPDATSYLTSAHSRIQSLNGATYEAELPKDYLHLLNCVCVYYLTKQKDCYDAGSYIQIPATRLTADSWS